MAKKTANPAAPQAETASVLYRLLLWLLLGLNSVFLIWQCLDRYLAPRFLFLSLVLLAGLVYVRKGLIRRADWRFHAFDLLLIGWYALSFASVSWAFSRSEALFYVQKTLLLFAAYWMFRQFLFIDENLARRSLRRIVNALSVFVCVLISGQLLYAIQEGGLSNNTLYAYASGVFGNKSLAADFLFFLLALQALFYREQPKRWVFPVLAGLILLLILLLQVRTVYGALLLFALIYLPGQAFLSPVFRAFLLKRLLPLSALLFVAGMVWILRSGGSLAERLNPMTYLESTSLNERRFVWYKTDLLNTDHYWLGVGAGSWKIWFPSKSIQGAYRLQEENIVFTRAHNDYLEIRAEQGMLGIIYFSSLFVLAFLAAFWSLTRTSIDRENKRELLALSAGLGGYCLIQYFDFPRERIEMQVLLALFFALMAHQSRDFWKKWPGISLSPTPNLFFIPISLLLCFNLWIGWNRVVGEIYSIKLFDAMSKGQFKSALDYCDKAENPFLEYNDVVLPLSWYRGIAQFRLNNIEASLTELERAVQLNPWSFQVLNNYATALASAGKNQESVPYFEQMLAINPAYDDGKINLATVYQRLGQSEKALKTIESIDTIANPTTEKAIQKNKEILAKKAEAIRGIMDEESRN